MTSKAENSLARGLEAAARAVVRDYGILDTIGLGTGRAVALYVTALAQAALEAKATPTVIPTSLQIQLEAEEAGLSIGSPSLLRSVQLAVDGADQLDKELHMVKGGGGALLKEKVLHYAARRVVIIADELKHVERLNHPVPLEVIPYAKTVAEEAIRRLGGSPKLRIGERGYPYITENGNIILDADFGSIPDPPALEAKLRFIPGVIEAGLFSTPINALYKALEDGTYTVVKPA